MNWLSTQYLRNAETFDKMAAKARATGKTVNHYTAEQLEQGARDYRVLASLDDDEMAAHQTKVRAKAAADLAAMRAARG